MSPSLNPDPKVKTQLMKYINSGVIDVVGTDSFRFVKNAILNTLDVHEDTLSVLGESKRTLKASYVYLPEKDKVLNKRLKKLKTV
jgi:hypothetical protein